MEYYFTFHRSERNSRGSDLKGSAFLKKYRLYGSLVVFKSKSTLLLFSMLKSKLISEAVLWEFVKHGSRLLMAVIKYLL